MSKDAKAFYLSAAVGFALWFFSHPLFGRREPWDGDVGLYLLLLCGGGFLATALFGSKPRSSYFGAVAGQVAYGAIMFVQGDGDLFPLGAIVLLVFSLPVWIAAGVAAALRK